MSRQLLTAAMMIYFAFTGAAVAGEPKVVFGPQLFERQRGGPEEFQASFPACDPNGSFKVVVENGDSAGKNRISSGTVAINGTTAVSQNDFNQGVARIERPAYGIKKDGNLIEVKLQSAPGAKVTVTVEGIMNCLEVHLTSPEDGAVINDYGTIITGTIEAQDGAEVGVSVNGVPAEVSGKTFAVSGVPLIEGENTIAAKATDDTGNTAEDSVKVTLADASVSPVYLSAYPASGQAPLDVKFTVDDTSPAAKILYEMDFEADGVVDVSAQDMSVFTSEIAHKYESEGIYYPTVTIKNEAGEIFFKKIIVNVFKMPDLGKKWDNMTAALTSGNIDSAVRHLSLSTRESYQKTFQALADSGVLAQAVASMGDMQIVKTMGNAAEGDMRVVRDGKEYSFYILFIKDEDGIWRIKSF